MHNILTKFNTHLPFPDVFPKDWTDALPSRDYIEFRNLEHFFFLCTKLKQKNDGYCDMTYADALKKMISGVSDFPETEQASIRDLVRSNLHKRGLITEEVYEQYKYAVEGTQVGIDPAKYAAGEPDCVITPTRQYIDFFYELYVSISYSWGVKNERIRESCAKMLATVEELERQHIFIKIQCVLPIRNPANGHNFFATIPMFSHKDTKSVNTMSAVINDRLLRKFFFAILEDFYGDELREGYGHPMEMSGTMNVGNVFNEVEFFETVMNTVAA